MVYCLVTSPLLLVVMALAGGAAYFISNRNKESKLMIAGTFAKCSIILAQAAVRTALEIIIQSRRDAVIESREES